MPISGKPFEITHFTSNLEHLSSGGQIEFIPFDEFRGMRVFRLAELSDSESPSKRLEEEVGSLGLRSLLLESTLSLFFTGHSSEVVPKLHGIGLLIPESEDSFFIELSPNEPKQDVVFEALQFIFQRGCELKKSGAEPKFFSLVEKIPVAMSKDLAEIDTEKYYSPYTQVGRNPIAYKKGLVAGLQFYQQCMQQGIWNFDINGKDPFIINGNGNAKVIDTSGFVTLINGELEKRVKAFYEFEITEHEEEIREETRKGQEKLPDQELREYDELSNKRDNLKLVGQDLLNQLQIYDRIYKTSDVLVSLEAKEVGLLKVGDERRMLTERLTEYQDRENSINKNQEAAKSANMARKERESLYKTLNEIEYDLKRHNAAKKFILLAREYISMNLDDPNVRKNMEDEIQKVMSLAGASRALSQEWGEFCTESMKRIRDRYEKLGSSPDIEIEKLDARLLEINSEMERVNLVISVGEKQPYVEPVPIGAIERIKDRLRQLKTEEEIPLDQQKIIETREIVHNLIRHQILEEKKIALDKAAQTAADKQIRQLRDICFTRELPKATGKTLKQSNIANLLKECGFERYLATLELDEATPLSEIYTRIKSNSYHKDLNEIFEDIINLIPQ